MKKKIFVIIGFVAFISLAVNLWNPISGSLTRNVKYGEGVQIADTLLTKGLNIFEGLAGSGTGVATLDNNGKVGFGTAASISPWTGDGTNVYLRDSTENVTIGRNVFDSDYKLDVFGNVIFRADNGGSGEFSVTDVGNNIILSFGSGVSTFNVDTAGIAIGGGDNSSLDISFLSVVISALPTDSAGLNENRIWVDANGFLRRKFAE